MKLHIAEHITGLYTVPTALERTLKAGRSFHRSCLRFVTEASYICPQIKLKIRSPCLILLIQRDIYAMYTTYLLSVEPVFLLQNLLTYA